MAALVVNFATGLDPGGLFDEPTPIPFDEVAVLGFGRVPKALDDPAGGESALSGQVPDEDLGIGEMVPASHEQYLWDSGWQFGEWLEGDERLEDAIGAALTADHGPVATAYLHRSASELADIGGGAGENQIPALVAQVKGSVGSQGSNREPSSARKRRLPGVIVALVAIGAGAVATLVGHGRSAHIG